MEVLDIKEIIECRFILKRVRFMIITNSPKHDGYQLEILVPLHEQEQESLRMKNCSINYINLSPVQRRKLYSSYQDHIWGADLANVQLRISDLCCVLLIFAVNTPRLWL